MGFNAIVWGLAFLYLAVKTAQSVRLVPTQSAFIVERLGRYHATLGAGFHVLWPFFDKVAYIQDLKESAIDVPPQECFTKDNVKVEVDGILYLSVVDPVAASYGITHFKYAVTQLVQTTIRSVIGTLDLDRTFEERDAINARVLAVVEEVSDSWGIRVHRYEVKGIVPPASVRRAMERQMTAERERRALLARSEGEMATRINRSEGAKEEAINRSEGEKQKRINEAEGRAQAILAVARATAESIEKLGAILASDGGTEAMGLRLSQQYLQKLNSLARAETSVVLSADLTRIDDLLAGVRIAPRPPSRPVVAGPPRRPVAPGQLPAGSVISPPRQVAAPAQATPPPVPRPPGNE